MLIKAYGLEDKALTSKVRIGFTANGADFSQMRGHTIVLNISSLTLMQNIQAPMNQLLMTVKPRRDSKN